MADFASNPNQRIVSITGKEDCDKSNIYAKINKKALFAAMNLSPSALAAWLYFAAQQNGYTFAFSPTTVANETGLKKQSIQKGVQTLIQEKYLVLRKDGSNIYDFYELPHYKEEQIQVCVNKYETDDGFVF